MCIRDRRVRVCACARVRARARVRMCNGCHESQRWCACLRAAMARQLCMRVVRDPTDDVLACARARARARARAHARAHARA
eukprot:3875199-Alexandrium_andersonii.AAC.1